MPFSKSASIKIKPKIHVQIKSQWKKNLIKNPMTILVDTVEE